MHKTKKTEDGRIELWWEGENAKTLHGVYENEEELNQYKEGLIIHGKRIASQ
jgi:hypothetical protein